MPTTGERVRVIPSEGRKVRDPKHPSRAAIPAKGIEVLWSSYWSRRLADGSVTVEKPKKPTGRKASTKPKTTTED